jgi:predicted ester cyclase
MSRRMALGCAGTVGAVAALAFGGRSTASQVDDDLLLRVYDFYANVLNRLDSVDQSTIDSYLHSSFTDRINAFYLPVSGEGFVGLDGFELLWAAFPDLRFEATAGVRGGSLVYVYYTMTGTHTGEGIFDIPATYLSVEVNGIDLFEFNDFDGVEALIVNHWGFADILSLQDQLHAFEEASSMA